MYKAFETLVLLPDPDIDSYAFCYIATLLNNRIDEYSTALESAEPCLKSQEPEYPALFFEAAWAAYKIEDNQKAKEYLGQYQKRTPDDDRASILNELINEAKIAKSTSDSAYDPPATNTDFLLRAGLFSGYNDNVIGLPDDYSLYDNLSDSEAAFLGLRVNAKYQLPTPSKNKMSVSYDLTTKFYESLSDYNSQFHRLSARYQHRFSKKLGGRLNTEFNNYLVGGDQLRHQYVMSGGLLFKPSWRLRLMLDVALTFDDYKLPVTYKPLRRDARSRQVYGTVEKSFTASRISLKSGLGTKDAEGNEYDNDFWYINAMYTKWFSSIDSSVISGRPVARLSWLYRNEDYENLSLFLQAKQTQERDVQQIGLYLGVPLIERKTIYISYRYTDQDSNIPFYEYAQNSISFGLNGIF